MIIERKVNPEIETPKVKVETTFLRINGIAGIHYTSEHSPSKTVMIFGIGVPLPPDNGGLVNAPHILSRGYDIFVPDYIGSGRSDGEFTPLNCIKTFTQLFESFTDGCEGRNVYDRITRKLRYERIIIAGRSFAGTYIPVLPRFKKEMQDLAVFYPVVDSKSQGTMEDETNELFLASMREDGYHHLYRGILDSVWIDHLENRDDLSPMDNLDSLGKARLFIGHGKKDTIVSYKKSKFYYDLLLKRFPSKDRDFVLALYSQGNHGPSTAIPATVDFLSWVDSTK